MLKTQADAEAHFRKLVDQLQSNDTVKALMPYAAKAAFGAAVGIAAHKVTSDKLV